MSDLNKNSLLNLVIDNEVNTGDRSKPNIDFVNLTILLIAVIALAFSPIFTKLSQIEISPTATVFNRLWIATIILNGWQLIKTPTEYTSIQLKQFNFNRQGLLILASFSATVSSVLWAISFTQTSVVSSTVLRSCTPIFISLGAWLVLKQQFNRQFIVGMLLSVVGAIFIGWDDLQIGTNHLFGDVIALLSAALHGMNILIIGYLRDRDYTTLRVLFWRCGFGALIVLPVVWFGDARLFPISLGGWLAVIALAVVCQTLGQGLLIYSLKQFDSTFVGIFTLLKPIVTALLAWIIFTESLNITNGVAAILILSGIFLAKTSSDRL